MNQEKTRKDVDECAGCGKKGDQHKGKGQIRWVGCDFCERWFVKECAPGGEKTPMMRCTTCRKVQGKMEQMALEEWPEMRREWEDIKEQIGEIHRFMKESRDEEKEPGTNREARRKAKDEERIREENAQLREKYEEATREVDCMQDILMCATDIKANEKVFYSTVDTIEEKLEEDMRDVKEILREIQTQAVDSMEEKLEEGMREVKDILREIQKQVEKGKQEEGKVQESRTGKHGKRRRGEEGTDRNFREIEADAKVELAEGDYWGPPPRAETSGTSNIEKRKIRIEPKEDGDRKQEEWDRWGGIRQNGKTDSEEHNNEEYMQTTQIINGEIKSGNKTTTTENRTESKERKNTDHNMHKARERSQKVGESEQRLRDHGYSRDKGQKRKSTGETPRGKRSTENERGLVIGDSLVKGMVEDPGLNRTALEQGWEIRMKRGGKIRDIEKMAEEEHLATYKWILICGGSNNLAGLHREQREDQKRELENTVERMKKIVQKGKEAGCKIGIITPPPRRDVDDTLRKKYQRHLVDMERDFGVVTIRTLHWECDKEEFQEEMRKDGIHITHTQLRDVIKRAMIKLTKEVAHLYEENEGVRLENMWKDRCWKCGGERHGRQEQCWVEGECKRCGRRGHSETVCVSKIQSCTLCGRWGHNKDMCTT